MERVQDTADRIKGLEIKGARKVAIAAVETLRTWAQTTNAKSRQEFIEELLEAKKILYASRPTEPFMRNATMYILKQAERSNKKKVCDLVEIVCSSSRDFLSILETSRERIAEIGAKRIRDGMIVFTHCHSSTVTSLLTKAKHEGRSFEVICTETRPLFQGRITAKEMLALGVKTTCIVDSAARSFMKKADLVLVGADAITSEGSVINKIGTAAIALFARETRLPFYVASELLKFDPATLWGECETIEERTRDEVWSDAPETLVVGNPAFEATRNEFIHALICEGGIIPPYLISELMHRIYPWVFEE